MTTLLHPYDPFVEAGDRWLRVAPTNWSHVGVTVYREGGERPTPLNCAAEARFTLTPDQARVLIGQLQRSVRALEDAP